MFEYRAKVMFRVETAELLMVRSSEKFSESDAHLSFGMTQQSAPTASSGDANHGKGGT